MNKTLAIFLSVVFTYASTIVLIKDTGNKISQFHKTILRHPLFKFLLIISSVYLGLKSEIKLLGSKN